MTGSTSSTSRGASVALAVTLVLSACGPGLQADSAPVQASTPRALPVACPSPTNDVTLDMEVTVPLLYAYSSLGIFTVFWGSSWDDDPANFKRDDVNAALADVIATPYFDRLCQYGVPGFNLEGSADTDGFFNACPDDPGATTSTPAIFSFMGCEEYAPFTGVPLAVGLPNPNCIACSLLPVDCADPVTLPAEPLCVAMPNPTGSRVYVVLLPKGTVIDDFGSRSCVDYGAYHFQIPSRALFQPAPPFVVPGTQGRPLNLAIIPTECYPTLASLVAAITHEVVEAATDPLPLTSWIDFSSASGVGGFDITHIGSLFTDGEAADICDALHVGRVDFTAPDGRQLAVAPYWSNADNSCVSIDATPPVSTAALSPPPGLSGWNNTDVVVTLSAVDPGAPASGVKELVFSASGAQPVAPTAVVGDSAMLTFTVEGESTLVFHAADQAGNVETDHLQPVRIDRTPPLVAFTGNAGTHTVDQLVDIGCVASDALSGIDSSVCANVTGPAWSFGLGSHTVVASATDRAGNVASASVTFTVVVTPDSLCALGRTFTAKPQLAEKLCCLLAQLDGACCEDAERILARYAHHVRLPPWAFTPAEADLLAAFAKALLPPACVDDPDDDGHGGDGHGGGGHGDDGHHRGGRHGHGDDLAATLSDILGTGGSPEGHHRDACDDDDDDLAEGAPR